ncbi:Starch-binding associating with outer membrane [Parapedobacter luteus]|uniref:Starch-binding associating with outer membrane n=1 Tax=Parapedobacter luteus TaxID=623280 RepID=A0A1T5D8E6_9SPHI|nr:RagB/SusD family nutrient uptake outer membrane protein [Parapedobacter luteus]SKB67877.1 Starch-binding associating with outer membrane [Parapedobacter luteus]
MKRINKTLILLSGLVFATSSCKDSFTELGPYNRLSEAAIFDTPENVELAANGVYSQAAIGTYAGGAGRGYPFGAASIQQAEVRGEDVVNLEQFYQITYEATYSTTSANNTNHWDQLYNLINQANLFIEGVRGAESAGIITPEAANVYEGEARFLRALSHHELLLHFSLPYAEGANAGAYGVPYRDFGINSTETVERASTVDRGTVAGTYEKILADLDYAESVLPANSPINRAGKGAAIGLKTRIKLHLGDWAGVIAEGTKLGTDATGGTFTSPIGSYSLTASPDGPFTNYSNNTESIFSIANGQNSNPGTNGSLARMLGPAGPGGRGLVSTSPNLYNASFWVAGDLRRELLQVQDETGTYRHFFTKKYTDYTTQSDWAPILRYAEVLLNVSEAYARTGNTGQALLLLNAVRDRSVPADARFTSAPTDLIQAILNERRIEFAAEGRRWPDIHRLVLDPDYSTGGIPAKIKSGAWGGVFQNDGSDYGVGKPAIAAEIPAIPYSDYRFLWPINNTEVTTNPILANQQNPNY